MGLQPEGNAFIDAWISRVVEAGGNVIIMPDEPNSLPAAVPVVTPRSNKRQRQASTADHNEDLEMTPRAPLLSCTLAHPACPFLPDLVAPVLTIIHI
jgi:hypothetical protein